MSTCLTCVERIQEKRSKQEFHKVSMLYGSVASDKDGDFADACGEIIKSPMTHLLRVQYSVRFLVIIAE